MAERRDAVAESDDAAVCVEAGGIGPVAGHEPAANRKHGLKDLNVQFCRTSDWFNIAMASAGQGLPLIRATTWLNHIEYEWEDPIRSPLLHFLAERYHLIRYDGRGNGLL